MATGGPPHGACLCVGGVDVTFGVGQPCSFPAFLMRLRTCPFRNCSSRAQVDAAIHAEFGSPKHLFSFFIRPCHRRVNGITPCNHKNFGGKPGHGPSQCRCIWGMFAVKQSSGSAFCAQPPRVTASVTARAPLMVKHELRELHRNSQIYPPLPPNSNLQTLVPTTSGH